MNGNAHNEFIRQAIAQNHHSKKFFTKIVTPNFSDLIYGKRLHASRIFMFYEMARFDILQGFTAYYRERYPMQEQPEFGQFVVVRLQYRSGEAADEPISGTVKIRSRLLVNKSPLLEFRQEAYLGETGALLQAATIKVAMVNEELKMPESLDEKILLAMCAYCETCFSETEPADIRQAEGKIDTEKYRGE